MSVVLSTPFTDPGAAATGMTILLPVKTGMAAILPTTWRDELITREVITPAEVPTIWAQYPAVMPG